MQTLDAIEKRWGCRKYSEKDVDKESLGTVLNAGRLAPSAGNLQDRSFIVVKKKETQAEIAKASGNQTWMQTAPVHIIVVAENKKNIKFFGAKGEKTYSIQDTAFSVQNMLLAATDLGLGCALVVGFNEDKIKEVLEITSGEPYAIVTLGHSAETAKPGAKYPLDKFVFFEKYGEKSESESNFGNVSNVKEQVRSVVSSGTESIKKNTSGLLQKIKSLFKKKQQEPLMKDHFMEEMPAREIEIPRQLPRK